MVQFAEIISEVQPTDFWRQLGQMGVSKAVATLPRGSQDWRRSMSDHPWSYAPLATYQEPLRQETLEIEVVEDNPPMEDIRFGGAGRDEELEHVHTLIRSLGKLGIPVWCYPWFAGTGWVRTQSATRGRGGAIVA